MEQVRQVTCDLFLCEMRRYHKPTDLASLTILVRMERTPPRGGTLYHDAATKDIEFQTSHRLTDRA